MSFIRVEKNRNYTVMSNYHLRDKRMSLKAKGLLSYMLSCSDEWNFTVKGLESVLKEGRDSIRAGLEELEKLGYLVREQQRTETGSFDKVDYIIYEEPRENEILEKAGDSVENSGISPCAGNPTTVESKPEKLTQRNTKKQRKIKEKNYYRTNLSVESVTHDVREQIGSTNFASKRDESLIANLIDIMVELRCLVACKDIIRIGKEEYPAALISAKLDKIKGEHIEYVLECFKHHKDKINNIKAYLQKSLISSPDTIDSYYYAEVQHDFRHKG